MNKRHILLRTLALLIAVLPALVGLPHAGVAATQSDDYASPDVQPSEDTGATPLKKILNPDGTLNLTNGFNGSLDVTGYTMQTGANGEPRFVSDGGSSDGAGSTPSDDKDATKPEPLIPGYYNWDSRFNPIGTDSSIDAVTTNGANVYVGGYFAVAGNVAAQRVAQWNGSQWSALGSGVNGAVHALAYGGGNLYVGGEFTQAGGISANRIARWDGSAWYAMGSGMDGTVWTIVTNGADAYVGGDFITAGGLTVNRIAKWNGSSWTQLDTGVGPGTVHAIATDGTVLYAGGVFQTAGGVTVNNIARWSGTSWSSLRAGVDGGQLDVLAITMFGEDVYVGGDFTAASGDSSISYVARWSPADDRWYSLGTGVNDRVSAIVHSTIGYGLYVGGRFSIAGGLLAKNIAQWSTAGGGWSLLGTGGSSNGTNSEVYSLGMTSNGYLFVGGSFGQAGGPLTNGGVIANNIARWYGYSWSALGAGLGVNGGVFAVLAVTIGSSTTVYVGGNFSAVGGLGANNIAKWDGSSWSTLGTGTNNGVNGAVFALAKGPGSDIYVGGAFTQADGITALRVAKWHAGSWSALSGGANGVVRAMAYNNYDQHLYVGGSFTQVGGNLSVNRIARWNSSSGWAKLWHGTGNYYNGVSNADVDDPGPVVNAIVISDLNEKVYVGGEFTKAGSQPMSNLASWGVNGTAYFWNRYGSANGSVNALAFLGDNLYVGGAFTSIAPGVPANSIARFNFDTDDWHSLGTGVNGPVNALAVKSSTLYVGGEFTMIGRTPANNVASWSSSSWYTLGDGIESETIAPNVRGLATVGSTLFVGGSFSFAGGKPSRNFARRYWVSLP